MIIYDNIHGYITLDSIATSIVNTPIFQRLRNIHQTGVLYLVFPTATHSRFEHSIGTYHLATKMITNIRKNQPDLEITDEIITLIGIAGLCHDLGHMMFSHLFDDHFLVDLPNYKTLCEQTENVIHENRSITLLNYLVSKYNVDLNKDQLKVIADLINPKNAEYSKWKSKYQVGRWIFQIISNPLNSIDVDKFDYIVRDTQAVGLKFSFDFSRIINDAKVIDNKICYSYQCSEDIYHMFFIRYRLHHQIYNHKNVKSVEILFINILHELEKSHNISQYILDPEKMCELQDTFIWHHNSNPIIKNLIDNIYMKKIPKLVYQDVSINKINIDTTKIDELFGKSSYQIVKFKCGYAGGKSNPLNHIQFYDLTTGKIIAQNKIRNFSLLINQKYQEHFLRVYCLDLEKSGEFLTFFEDFNKKPSTEQYNSSEEKNDIQIKETNNIIV